MSINRLVTDDILVTAYATRDERYFFIYRDDQRDEVLQTLGRWASDPELALTWYEAAVISQKVRGCTP